jgi:hypothetical protein
MNRGSNPDRDDSFYFVLCPSLGNGALFYKEEQPKHGAVHLSPNSVAVKNAWNYIPTSTYVFMSCAETGLGFNHVKHYLRYDPAS